MTRILLLLVSVGLLAADASAARMSLLELIGGGSRRSARSRRQAAGEKRRQIRVEHETAATNAAEAATTTNASTLATIADEVLASTNVVDYAVGSEIATADDDDAAAGTNAAPQAATNAVAKVWPKREGRPARISARKVYYDRGEGYAVFTGNVHVDGEEYQMHAQKAYVFFEGTNELKRVVATGDVAITNETKRAYGAKASYYRKTGMVVLYGDDRMAAEVRDEDDGSGEDQVVKGSKIKFWIDSEQVEVIDARISAPVSGGLGDLKKGLESN